jgi:hypothetical protein
MSSLSFRLSSTSAELAMTISSIDSLSNSADSQNYCRHPAPTRD